MDWIIKIVKDFEDHYTTLTEAIETGKTEIAETTAQELADTLATLNAWYTEHQNDISSELANAITTFDTHANAKLAEVLASIPADYSHVINSLWIAYDATRVEYKNDMVFRTNQLYLYTEYVPSNSEWSGSKVIGLPLARACTRGINIAEIGATKNRYENVLQYAIRRDGIARYYSNGNVVARDNLTTFDRVPVVPGAKLIVSYWLGSETYCMTFTAGDGSALPIEANRRIPYTSVEGGIIVPPDAYWAGYTVPLAHADDAFVYVIPPEDYSIHNFDIFPITSIGELVNDQPYNAFPGMTDFNNKRVLCWFSGNDHYNSDMTGGITIADIDNNGFLTIHDILTMDNKPWHGVLRGAELSTTRDGKYLLFAGFSNYKVDGVDTYDNVFMRLDDDYSIAEIKVMENASSYVFGKILQTPTGKLICGAYNGHEVIHLLSSTMPYDGTNLSGLTFLAETIMTGVHTISEADICYTPTKLICVARVQTTSALYKETEDLEGATGWSDYYNIGEIIHAPHMLQYYNSKYIIIVGAKYIDASTRKPVIVVYDTNSHTIVDSAILNENVNGFCAYSDIAKDNDNQYGIIYYSDPTTGTNNCTQLYYQTVTLSKICPATKYIM